jgi:hypothetical protein
MGRGIKKGLCGAVGERCCSARRRAPDFAPSSETPDAARRSKLREARSGRTSASSVESLCSKTFCDVESITWTGPDGLLSWRD